MWYPFRTATLQKLQKVADDSRERLKLTLQVLQLDVSTTSQRTLGRVAIVTTEAVAHVVDVNVSVARVDAQTQRLLAVQQSDQFRKITNWLSPPDPWSNHKSSCRRYEPQTGAWLLESDLYRSWKTGAGGHLWLSGKAGCGKTVLCSSVVEDIRTHCKNMSNSTSIAFYFSFSDTPKQFCESLLRLVVAQLGWREPGLSMLVQAHGKPGRSQLGVDEMEDIVVPTCGSFHEGFLVMDAVDECPESGEAQRDVLVRLEQVLQRVQRRSTRNESRRVRHPGVYGETRSRADVYRHQICER